MALYRMRRNSTKGSKKLVKGQIIPGDTFTPEAIDKLLAVGAISRVSTPPLSEVYGWEARAKKLFMVGIDTVEEFLEADVSKVATQLKVSRATVQRLRTELEQLLAPPPRDGCEGCRD